MYLTNEERIKRASGMSDAPMAAPAMPCSECRNTLRTVYFNLDGRPLCPRCSATYRDRIDRGTGPTAMGRAVMYGAGAAFLGMLGVGILLMFVGAFRIVASVGVAYLVARAIGKATANYGGRHYQVLAVSLTYLALGLAMLFPVLRAARELSKVQAPSKREARFGPAGERAEIKDELSAQANPVNNAAEDPAVVAARMDSITRADSIERLAQTRANLAAHDGNFSAAARLTGGFGAVLMAAVALLFVLPILSAFSYGIYAGVLSIFGLVFAMKKAWELTALVTDYDLTGPFRVGEGAIAATMGV